MKPPQDLAANIARNTIFGVLARAAYVGTRLIMIPIVISHLGLDGYGIWNVIMAIAAYLRFGSVGVKCAFQKYVAEATGKGEYDSANRLLSTGCALMLALSAALIPVVIFSRSLAAAAGIPPSFLASDANAISILGVMMAVSNVGSVFEAIVMGGHRIDITRRLTTLFTVLEAGAIVVLLHLGFGLCAMATVMAASELGCLTCCAVVSRRVVPEVTLSRRYVTRKVIPELLRFAGTYQLVSILEVLYAAILPVVILKTFGADASGVYAVAIRLTSSALALSDSFLIPILSGSAMVYASGSAERVRTLMLKSFKAVVGLSLFPLGFIAIFGARFVYAWTGQPIPMFRNALWLASIGAFCQSVSLLQLVLYRASGRALMDNLRQALRIFTLLVIAFLAQNLGFDGTLAGFALAELVGMVFMLYAMAKTFDVSLARPLATDAARLAVAVAGALAIGAVGLRIPLPPLHSTRLGSALQVGAASVVGLLCLWPALRVTRALSATESRAVRSIVLFWKIA